LRGENIEMLDFATMAGKTKYVPEDLLRTAWGL
jgi:hypothetical protein